MRITDLITGLSGLLWAAALGLIVLITVQTARGQKMKNGRTLIIVLLTSALVLTTLSAGLVFGFWGSRECFK